MSSIDFVFCASLTNARDVINLQRYFAGCFAIKTVNFPQGGRNVKIFSVYSAGSGGNRPGGRRFSSVSCGSEE